MTYLDAQLARYRAGLEDAMATGVSRLGGSPDFLPDVPWPADDDGTLLSFIAQLEMRQVAAHDA